MNVRGGRVPVRAGGGFDDEEGAVKKRLEAVAVDGHEREEARHVLLRAAGRRLVHGEFQELEPVIHRRCRQLRYAGLPVPRHHSAAPRLKTVAPSLPAPANEPQQNK